MISRIELHNFMSHCHTVIEPAAGLTVLVGPNNCGKSAVVSALQILCENAQGDYMVRHGADECRVVVETADGHRVEWQRRKGVVSYNVDGEDFHRLSGGIPARLHDVLRLAKVVAADNRDPYDIHFGAQKSPIFLLNEPGSRAATFFASSSDAAKLTEMQSLHRSKGAQARKDEARLAEQVNGLALRLEVLGPVAQLEQAISRATEDYQAIADLSWRLCTLWQDLTDLSRKLAAVEQLNAEVAAFARLGTPPQLADTSSIEEIVGPMTKNMGREARETAVIHVLDRLAEPPVLVDLMPIGGLIENLGIWTKRRDASEATSSATEDLAAPPEIADIGPLEVLCKGIEDLQTRREALSAQLACLAPLTDAPAMCDTVSLEGVINQLVKASRDVRRAEEPAASLAEIAEPPRLANEETLVDLLDDLEEAQRRWIILREAQASLDLLSTPPIPVDVESLGDLIAQIDIAQSSLDSLQRDKDTAIQGVAEVEQALRRWAEVNRVCPTCGAELDPERIVSIRTSSLGGHRHD